MESESDMVNLHKLKLGAEKLEALMVAIDAIDEVTLAIQAVEPSLQYVDVITQNLVAIQNASQNALDAIEARDQALIYRNETEVFAGGDIVASDVLFTDETTVEAFKTTTNTHFSNTSNPHSVTKAQVNLGSVDNTSDADKPVSTAQSTALGLKLDKTGGTMTGAITALRETKVAMGANDIDLSLGNVFTKTISGATTFTISNALATGNVNSFTLRLTNGGAYAITWFSGVKWSGGTAPTLTASGVDRISFESDDGGTAWEQTGILKDIK